MNAEIEKMVRIDELMKEWATYCHSQVRWKNAIFVEDGPFPYYGQQKPKILFIPRELPGAINTGIGLTRNYIEDRLDMINLGIFQSRLLYLAHGIINREYSKRHWLKTYDSGKGAGKLNRKFSEDPAVIEGAFSYAFINVSKLLNTEGINIGKMFYTFIKDTVNRAFFLREIELLNPDIIVSGNLADLGFSPILREQSKLIQKNTRMKTVLCGS